MAKNVYVSNGYLNRADYLNCMASEYGVSLDTVLCLAEVLGHNEDFDGLINSLEDFEEYVFDEEMN